MKKKVFILFVLTILISALSRNSFSIPNSNYTESLDALTYNPERGFYRTDTLILHESGNKPLNIKSSTSNLLWLRVDISDFSGAQREDGKDIEITSDAINALSKTLENIKNNNNSVIIRFVYDKYGDGIKSDEGKLDDNGKRYVEPSIEMINNHIKSFKDVFSKYSRTIYTIQVGFFGDYGEMHGTSMCTSSNFNSVIDTLLKNTDSDIPISVRTPGQILSYYNFENGTNINISNIDTLKINPNMLSYRLGIYDDGYLGSSSDLGTYRNREKEISFLDSQNTHTTFGGEAVINYDNNAKIDNYKYINKYSLISNLELEALRTHTDYLNYEWNNKLHDDWKSYKYNGTDKFYNSLDNCSSYDYINSHLGYRYVLRDSEIKSNNDTININASIENTGFSNIKKAKDVKLIVVNSNSDVVILKDTDIDFRALYAKKTGSLNFNIDVPNNFGDGNYRVYMQVASGKMDNGDIYLPVRFANNDIWNDNIKANYIGSFNYTRIKEYSKDDNNKEGKSNTNVNNDTTNKEIDNNAITNRNNSNDNNNNNNNNNNANVNSNNKSNSKSEQVTENSVINNTLPTKDDFIEDNDLDAAEYKNEEDNTYDRYGDSKIFTHFFIIVFTLLGALICISIINDLIH